MMMMMRRTTTTTMTHLPPLLRPCCQLLPLLSGVAVEEVRPQPLGIAFS
jgi:hypothetical protein